MGSDRSPHKFPTFTDVADERRHRKQRLAAAFRIFGAFGFDEGTAGHITARDPELTDHFWVNPVGVAFSRMRVSDLQLVSHDGRIVIGDGPVNRAAFAIHSEVHLARPDVVAAAHAHSDYGIDDCLDGVTIFGAESHAEGTIALVAKGDYLAFGIDVRTVG